MDKTEIFFGDACDVVAAPNTGNVQGNTCACTQPASPARRPPLAALLALALFGVMMGRRRWRSGASADGAGARHIT